MVLAISDVAYSQQIDFYDEESSLPDADALASWSAQRGSRGWKGKRSELLNPVLFLPWKTSSLFWALAVTLISYLNTILVQHLDQGAWDMAIFKERITLKKNTFGLCMVYAW
jgi:hypothetical protein